MSCKTKLKWLIFVLLLVALGYTIGYYKAESSVPMFNKIVDVWQGDGFGNSVTWMRSTTKPYEILYIKIKTNDGVEHKLRRI